ncbi:MlaD family protein [Nocardia sp. NPDC005978]|uniref:MlaD family protein n=1 Tax=unclassified Nocardia TaxID=2637762 RepID=UPI0033B83C8D
MGILRDHKTLLSNVALVSIMLLGGAYLAFGVARVRPPGDTFAVTVHLDKSGGLQSGNDVTWRGYRVGKIRQIQLVDGGAEVAAVAEIDRRYDIPADTAVYVGGLSGAGEQYLDFRPNTDAAPYLSNGTVIRFDPERITTPVPIWSALDNTSALLAQIDPNKLTVILNELDVALSGGPEQLRHLVEGISLATTGLDNLLPQTTSLIENLRVIADTSSHAQPDLGTLTRNSRVLVDQANGANAELRQLLADAPGQLAIAEATLTRNEEPIEQLAHTLSAIVTSALLRTPALRALFPGLVVGTSAMGVPAHDNEFHTILDAWPRPWCDYTARTTPLQQATDGTFPSWNYCVNPPPEQQIRGSGNAPRPDIPNNGAQMPTGADPNERTPLPVR